MLRLPLRYASQWFARATLPGRLALRVWLVLGIMAPALGLGGWARPAAAALDQVAEAGLHSGPEGHGDPAEHAPDLPLRSEAEVEVEDSEDELRERTSIAPIWLTPALYLFADSRGHRFDDAHDGGPGSCHRGALHNRGPPVA